jgi:hypothetical protein
MLRGKRSLGALRHNLLVDYDVFVCYASEDRDAIARPLAHSLGERGWRVWLDELQLRLGDSLRRKIDEGLRGSRFGVVILSPAFFAKEWPQWELDGLADREMQSGSVVVLPVWHGVEHDEVAAYSPSLAGKMAASTAVGLDSVVAQIESVLAGTDPQLSHEQTRVRRVDFVVEHDSKGAHSWLRGDHRIGVLGILATLGVAVAGAAVAVATPEARCALRLDNCGDGSSTATQIGSTGIATTVPEAGEPIVEAPLDPQLPYSFDGPPPRAVGEGGPVLEVPFNAVRNRGRPVPVPISGSLFSAHSDAEIEVFAPKDQVRSFSLQTDGQGSFRTTLLWLPLQWRGIAGNNGGWRIRARDLATGKAATAQFNVTADSRTPPPSEWVTPDTVELRPRSPAQILASTSGTLCTSDGAVSKLEITGFTPAGLLDVSYFRADGRRVKARGDIADGLGAVTVLDYWTTQNCQGKTEFIYSVAVTEQVTGRRAEATIGLGTR